MKLNIGDKVRFLNEVGGGKVSRIEGKDMVYVLDDDGFEVPALMTEVVLVERKTADTSSANSKQELVEQDSFDYEESETDDEPKMLLALVQDVNIGGNVNMYYINDSNYFAFYTISKINKDVMSPLYNGTLEPNTKVTLDTLAINYIDDSSFQVQVIFYKKDKDYTPIEPIIEKVSFSGAKLMKDASYVENDYLNDKAVLVHLLKDSFSKKLEELTDKDIKKAMKEKAPAAPKKSNVKRRDDKEILEVDLHIHELLDITTGLSNRDMLDVQLKKFHEVMAANEKNKKRKIVFIHGVGNGTLKTEIRKSLDRKYKWHDYQDASFQEYGWGATMVII
ncbi:DUF2027 domain-containing protein [Saccharicrinis aurantiacus]|uniref:DUF2027 domain-containing protein n=1 Tax=Saccharicrinis aurantiacus TaxID=1849719 RepID=UPI000839541B|nr:DUF2027 domain-containing protein [Saccharicrinis aurantiacus]